MNAKKERERIKWEYLKRSDFYREFCELNRTPGKPIPDKFQPVQGDVFKLNPVVHAYIHYGDVHAKSFDDWYIKYHGQDSYKVSSLSCVDDLSKGERKKHYLYNIFHYIIDRFKKISGDKEPSLLEMADCLWITIREDSEQGHSWLRITQSDYTAEEAKQLANDVYKILMARVPKDRLREEDLEKYLKVYDMRKAERTDTEIIKAIYDVKDLRNVEGKRTKEAKSDKELTDEINKYFRYAERLIDNAVKDIYSNENIFPGDYWKR